MVERERNLVMKSIKPTWILGAMIAALGAGSICAQTNNPPPTGTPPGQPAIADRANVIPLTKAPERRDLPGRSDRPPVPERPAPSKEVKDLVKDFQSARRSFLTQQQELMRQLKSSTDEQRTALRAQLKENLSAWMEEQKAHLQDIREQAKEIKNNVPAIKDVIDAGGGEGRGR